MKTQMNRIAKVALSLTVLASFASCGAKKSADASAAKGIISTGSSVSCTADFGTISTGLYVGKMRVAISFSDGPNGSRGSFTVATDGRALENNIVLSAQQFDLLFNRGQTMIAQRLLPEGVIVTDQIFYRNNTVTITTGLGNQFNVPCGMAIGY